MRSEIDEATNAVADQQMKAVSQYVDIVHASMAWSSLDMITNVFLHSGRGGTSPREMQFMFVELWTRLNRRNQCLYWKINFCTGESIYVRGNVFLHGGNNSCTSVLGHEFVYWGSISILEN